MKKSSLNTIIIATAFSLSASAWAQQPSGGNTLPPSPSVSPGGIQALEQYLNEMYLNVGNFITGQNYQPIPRLAQTITSNTTSTTIGLSPIALSPQKAVIEKAKQETKDNLSNSLQQFQYGVYSSTKKERDKMQTAEGTSFDKYMNHNKLSALISDPEHPTSQASDTLHGTELDAIESTVTKANASITAIDNFEKNKKWVEKPKENFDNNFNFANLFNEKAYSPSEQAAAQKFVVYGAQSTQNLISNIGNLSKLSGNTSALIAVKKSAAYQNFAMTMRTLLAIRSISINALNQLINERTPMPGLASAAGLDKLTNPTEKETQELKDNVASPLQVEDYQANHRFEDPNWYQSIQNDSPATVQRNTLILLTEIEHQNYQAHIDRERLLSAILASNLEKNLTTMSTVLQQSGGEVNSEINSVLNPPKKNTKPAQPIQTQKNEDEKKP